MAKFTLSLVTLTYIALLIRSSSSANIGNKEPGICPDDFSPCNCAILTNDVALVTCNGVPYSDIQTIFNSTTNIYSVDLNIFTSEMDNGKPVPSNLLGEHRAFSVQIYCFGASDFQLMIFPDAFSSSKNSLRQFKTQFCSLQALDWRFLDGFQSIARIESFLSPHWSTATLPSLPSLDRLIINSCDDFISWGDPVLDGLQILDIQYVGIDDAATKEILSSVSMHSSLALQALNLANNNLTYVPENLNAFTSLGSFSFMGNSITSIPFGAVTIQTTAVLTNADLSYNQISDVEPGAFKGDFSSAYLSLSGNKITTFKQETFEPLLRDMVKGSGKLEFYWNEVLCDCTIAWLLRDNRDLLPAVVGGTCSDSTYFEDVNPLILAQCP